MPKPKISIVAAAQARQALTDGDIRSEVAFQNDINTLLACLEEKQPALKALAPPVSGAPRLRAARGGKLRRRGLADGGAELLAQEKVALAEGETEQLTERFVALRQLA